MRGSSHASFGKRPTEKDPVKGTSPAVDFTLWEPGSEALPGHPAGERPPSPAEPRNPGREPVTFGLIPSSPAPYGSAMVNGAVNDYFGTP